MAASSAELELRLRAVEARTARIAEDGDAYAEVITDTAKRVRRIERGLEVIAAALNVEIPDETDPELD